MPAAIAHGNLQSAVQALALSAVQMQGKARTAAPAACSAGADAGTKGCARALLLPLFLEVAAMVVRGRVA